MTPTKLSCNTSLSFKLGIQPLFLRMIIYCISAYLILILRLFYFFLTLDMGKELIKGIFLSSWLVINQRIVLHDIVYVLVSTS